MWRIFPRESSEQNESDRWPNPLGRRISKEGVGEVVTGSAVHQAIVMSTSPVGRILIAEPLKAGWALCTEVNGQ